MHVPPDIMHFFHSKFFRLELRKYIHISGYDQVDSFFIRATAADGKWKNLTRKYNPRTGTSSNSGAKYFWSRSGIFSSNIFGTPLGKD
jgi:hypothetical protein